MGILKRAGLVNAPRRVLDIGSGDGWFLSELIHELPNGSSGVGWDLGYEPGTVQELGLDKSSMLRFTQNEPDVDFDLLLMLDVLEHVRDDAVFLHERVTRNLKPGGFALISVPAWPELFTAHDSALGHFRRYRPGEFRARLRGAGLVIEKSGGLFHTLTLPRAMQRVREYVRPVAVSRPKGFEWQGGPLLTRVVDWALELDNRVSSVCAERGKSLPGLSVWALCTKPAAPSQQGPDA
jgi:SAM-dependent methyltransferase